MQNSLIISHNLRVAQISRDRTKLIDYLGRFLPTKISRFDDESS